MRFTLNSSWEHACRAYIVLCNNAIHAITNSLVRTRSNPFPTGSGNASTYLSTHLHAGDRRILKQNLSALVCHEPSLTIHHLWNIYARSH